MARATVTNMFSEYPELALDAVGAASRLLLDMAVSEEASMGTAANPDPDNRAAALNMLGGLLYDAHAVLLGCWSSEMGKFATEQASV